MRKKTSDKAAVSRFAYTTDGSDCIDEVAAYYKDRIAQLTAELAEANRVIERLKELLRVSEDFRKAYQDGKYKLYAMGGDICEAAATHLPMSEGPLDRACRKALGTSAERKA